MFVFSANEYELPEQLQRIISRCGCRAYFCQFSEDLETFLTDEATPPDSNASEDFFNKVEYVDCFTLKHDSLIGCTNHVRVNGF